MHSARTYPCVPEQLKASPLASKNSCSYWATVQADSNTQFGRVRTSVSLEQTEK